MTVRNRTVLNRLKEYFAFTHNEQKIFFFLALVFFAGVAIKVYKSYVVPAPLREFDYSRQDSLFAERTNRYASDTTNGTRGIVSRINLNSATKTELMTLPGIGEATAERIILLREEKGKFYSVHDLKKVKGIGEKKFEKLKPYIEVQ